MLLMCKIASGFNPDAAASSTSAAGLGQYTEANIAEVAKPQMSKQRLGFTLDLSGQSVFEAERGAYGVLVSHMKSKELAIKHFGKEYENNLYIFQHEGWNFQPTSENMALEKIRHVTKIIKDIIVPFLDRLENMLSANCELSFKLLTKDGLAFRDQPYLAIFPSRPSVNGLVACVQGTTQQGKFVFGKTDQSGLTLPITAAGLSEIVFVILTKHYKELLNVQESSKNESQVKTTRDSSSRNDTETTAQKQQKINQISHPKQLRDNHTIQPHDGRYLWRRPPMELVENYLLEALNTQRSATSALVEFKRSHIVLPKGNRAQNVGADQSAVVFRADKNINELKEREKITEVPHTTVQQSITKLVPVALARSEKALQLGLLFPIPCKPAACYRSGSRAFNSTRASTRRHAGCDIYAPVGTEVRAMADGVIEQCYPFYCQTDAIDVNHGSFLVRYCELMPRPPEDQKKLLRTPVKRGDVIGKVGQLINPDGSKFQHTMLHVEMYETNISPLKEQLTQKQLVPFQRRSDLIDPSGTLDSCEQV